MKHIGRQAGGWHPIEMLSSFFLYLQLLNVGIYYLMEAIHQPVDGMYPMRAIRWIGYWTGSIKLLTNTIIHCP